MIGRRLLTEQNTTATAQFRIQYVVDCKETHLYDDPNLQPKIAVLAAKRQNRLYRNIEGYVSMECEGRFRKSTLICQFARGRRG